MEKLTWHDLQFALVRCPKPLLAVMKSPEWAGKVFVGGGFLRSVVAGESVNDVDVFVSNAALADSLALDLTCRQLYRRDRSECSSEELKDATKRVHKTENALTLLCFKPTIQIIHRWVFESAAAVSDSFDFTCCCAAFWWDLDRTTQQGVWQSVCDPRFYPDVAAKRLIYRSPVRNEDAGGSMLRVLKYYQKGYRIPVNCLGAVIGRLMASYAPNRKESGNNRLDESRVAKVVTGLLREVDPAIDPKHVAHLPAESVNEIQAEE